MHGCTYGRICSSMSSMWCVCVCVDGCRYDFVYVLKHFVRTCLEVCQTFEILQDTPRPLVVAGGLAAGQATGWNPQHLH